MSQVNTNLKKERQHALTARWEPTHSSLRPSATSAQLGTIASRTYHLNNAKKAIIRSLPTQSLAQNAKTGTSVSRSPKWTVQPSHFARPASTATTTSPISSLSSHAMRATTTRLGVRLARGLALTARRGTSALEAQSSLSLAPLEGTAQLIPRATSNISALKGDT